MEVRLHFPSQRVSSMVKSFTGNLHEQNNNHNNITLGATLRLCQITSKKKTSTVSKVFFLFFLIPINKL